MEQEILSPENQPKSASQGFSGLAGLMAALGATLMVFCLTGAAMVSTVWAVSKLFGFPDWMLYGMLVLGAIPVLWLTIWTAGRAWHVEKLLAAHRDIDSPEFKLGHYFRNG